MLTNGLVTSVCFAYTYLITLGYFLCIYCACFCELYVSLVTWQIVYMNFGRYNFMYCVITEIWLLLAFFFLLYKEHFSFRKNSNA